MVARPSYEIVPVRGKPTKHHSDVRNLHLALVVSPSTFSSRACIFERCIIDFNWHLSISEFSSSQSEFLGNRRDTDEVISLLNGVIKSLIFCFVGSQEYYVPRHYTISIIMLWNVNITTL